MKIGDLDLETKRIIVIAHRVLDYRTEENFQRLRQAVKDFDEKHAVERHYNLLRALFGKSDSEQGGGDGESDNA